MKRIASAVLVATGPKYTQSVETGGFSFLADEPLGAGGGNAGPAPYNLLLASLGACTAITLRMYAERKNWAIGALRVALTVHKGEDGATRIERRLSTDVALDPAQWVKLLEIAEKTPVTRTLREGASISTSRE